MFESLLAALIVASLSVIGILLIGRSGHLQGSHRYIIPVAIGVFLGVIFFELIPETLHEGGLYGSIAIVIGFLSFYLLSHFLGTYHHHHRHGEDNHDECEASQRSARMLLIGDAVHNIADGVIIATAFLINPAVGIATTVGIALHEIPQEIAEFGVLVKAGYSRTKALMLNFVSATSIFIGVIIAFIFVEAGDYVWILTGLAAGNLLYIAASDMLPELQEHTHADHFLKTFFSTILGLVAITALLMWSHQAFEDEHENEAAHTVASMSEQL